jgi:lipid II isoglutaminyl synthase (glutamine-hydrolysing)
MTDRVGRHAAARDLAETLIIPAQQARAGDEPPAGADGVPQRSAPRAAGRHASGRSADLASTAGAGRAMGMNGHESPLNGHQSLPNGHQSPANGYPGRKNDQQAGTAARAQQQRPLGGDRKLRLVWVYPDLLSTYGDRGNLLVLSRRAALRGIDVEAIEVNADEPVPSQGDIYLLGGGEDLPQILAANRLRQDGGLARAADRGAVVFAVCAGYQVIGDSFGGVEGEPVAGLGILDISSGRGDRRGVGELVADVDPTLGVPRLTGFENHQGVTRIGSAARPLARVSLGVGNGDGTEGAYAGNVLGTYMHGPALARNPGLADLLLSWAAGQLPPLDPDAEEWAGRLRSERLAAVER